MPPRVFAFVFLALSGLQLVKCAKAPVMEDNYCIDITYTPVMEETKLLQSSARESVSRFVKCAAILSAGKVVGVYGGTNDAGGLNAVCKDSSSQSDCESGGGSTVDCPSAAATGATFSIDANKAAVCCACKKMVEDGLGVDFLPPACNCNSGCTGSLSGYGSGASFLWEGTGEDGMPLDCSGCGNGIYTDTPAGFTCTSSSCNSGFDYQSNVHAEYKQECGDYGTEPVSTQEDVQLLQTRLQTRGKSKAGCNDPSASPPSAWSCNCAWHLANAVGTDGVTPCGTADPSNSCVQHNLCSHSSVCQSWKDTNCNGGGEQRRRLLEANATSQMTDDLLSLLAETARDKAKVGWDCG